MIKETSDGYDVICDECGESFVEEMGSTFPDLTGLLRASQAFDWKHDGRNRCTVCALFGAEASA